MKRREIWEVPPEEFVAMILYIFHREADIDAARIAGYCGA